MSISERVPIPLLSELISGGVKSGATILVEFDPVSQWFAVAATIAKKTMQKGGNVAFNVMARPAEEVEAELSALGVDVPNAFREGRFEINDWYSATLSGGRIEPVTPGTSIVERWARGSKFLSLKVQDLSVEWLKDAKLPKETSRIFAAKWSAGTLVLVDSFSMFLRFNEEKPFAEFLETRLINQSRKWGRIALVGLVSGLHSDWLYKRIQSATEGLVDIRVMEKRGKAENFIRVRSLRGSPHDSAWHQIKLKPNGEAVLAK